MKSRIARDEVNVEVDSGHSKPELGSILGDLRSQYEGIVKANKEQAELWYQKKVGGSPQSSTDQSEGKLKTQSTFGSMLLPTAAGRAPERGEAEQRGPAGSAGRIGGEAALPSDPGGGAGEPAQTGEWTRPPENPLPISLPPH